MSVKDKVVVGVLKTSMIGLQVGWALAGLGLVGLGVVIISTQAGYAALYVSGKKVS